MHKALHIFRRALDGAKKRPWMYALSCLTLTAAFLSFAATLTAAANLNLLLSKWLGSAELTAYVSASATEADYDKLSQVISKLSPVARVVPIPPAEAKRQFATDLGELSEFVDGLAPGAFPGSLDIHLTAAATADGGVRKRLAERLAGVELIEEVEQYDDWYERLTALTVLGRLAAWGLGLLALVVAVLVVTAVVRAGVSARAKEIEVLRLVGATGRYVRLPFLIEGAFQALLAMGLALLCLGFLNDYLQDVAGTVMPLIGAGSFTVLSRGTTILLIGGAAAAGIAGARLSLRGFEEV